MDGISRVGKSARGLGTMSAPRIAFVVAAARNGVIGQEGRLPWRISSDLKSFKAITAGKPVIMGRKTWESLPVKPLPGRTNIVLTRDESYRAAGATTVTTPDAAVAAAGETGPSEICVIGGGAHLAAPGAAQRRNSGSQASVRPPGSQVI